MALTGDAATAYVKTTNPVAPPTVYSWHIIYKNPAVPGTSHDYRTFSVGDASFVIDLGFLWHNSATPKSVFNKRNAGSYDIVAIPNALNANTYYRIGASFDGTTLRAYLNGSMVASIGSANGANSANPTVTVLAGENATTGFDDGTIAEVGYWNVKLSDNDFATLGAGYSPLFVRPDSLVVYWPLIKDIVPYFGPAISTTGTTVAAHPPVIYPDNEQMGRFDANATYMVTESGGIVIGDATTTNMAYVVTETGGIVIGGLSTIITDISWSTSMDFAQTEDSEAVIRHGLALAQTFTLDSLFVTWSTSIGFASKIESDSGELSNDRNRGIANNSRGIPRD